MFRFSKRFFCVSTTPVSPLSACVVGSGPSGFYTSKYLLKNFPNISVSIVESLPVPFGLVRYGVSPDHQSTKNVINDFTAVLQDERVSYYGNISVGNDISLDELKSIYNIVILCYGSQSDNVLGLLNEDKFNGIYNSRQFVNWYNGHPYFSDVIDRNGLARSKSVIIVGNGNVSIDCARLLVNVKSDNVINSDITNDSYNALNECYSNLSDVYIIGRRGLIESSFTNKELRELVRVENCISTVNENELNTAINNDNNRVVKRKLEILASNCKLYNTENELSELKNKYNNHKFLHFMSYLTPFELHSDNNNNINSISFLKHKNKDDIHKINCDILIKSIGYKSLALEDNNFINGNILWDDKNNCIKNERGKIINNNNLYCGGWISRLSNGIIGTNIQDANNVIKSITNDLENNNIQINKTIDSTNSNKMLIKLLNDKNIKFVNKEGWFKIDEKEILEGKKKNKIREKLIDINQMLKIANSV